MTANQAVPVLMYHSVGRLIPDWKWSYLTVPYTCFESHLRALAEANYTTIDLEELYRHTSGQAPLQKKSVVITFDDGYVDNWTYAAPLLERYGFKATVFVSPDFIDPRKIVRPTLQHVWEKGSDESKLETRGFMSWEELRRLSERGVFSVQSHLMTHTWYPVSDEVVDFHHPGDAYYWLDWNQNPEVKPYYLQRPGESRVPYGVPVYRHAKSMEATRYFPDEEESLALSHYVASAGGFDFFRNADWRQDLLHALNQLRRGKKRKGKREKPSDRLQRLTYELSESKTILQENLGVEVNFMAWPGGAYDDQAMELALKYYKSVTLSSRDKSEARNRPGDDPRKVRRIGVPHLKIRARIRYPGGRYLVQFLDEYRGLPFARQTRRLMKALLLLGASPLTRAPRS